MSQRSNISDHLVKTVTFHRTENLGIQLETRFNGDNFGVFVKNIKSGSPSSNLLLPDDEIIACDDLTVSGFDHLNVIRLIHNFRKKTLKLTVLRLRPEIEVHNLKRDLRTCEKRLIEMTKSSQKSIDERDEIISDLRKTNRDLENDLEKRKSFSEHIYTKYKDFKHKYHAEKYSNRTNSFKRHNNFQIQQNADYFDQKSAIIDAAFKANKSVVL